MTLEPVSKLEFSVWTWRNRREKHRCHVRDPCFETGSSH